MKKIQITTDSVSDLGEDLMKQHNIFVMPLMINLGNENMPDGEGLPERIYDYVAKTGKLPKTAARGVEEYKEFFLRHRPDGGELVHFSLSNKLSASNSMARAAAEEVPGIYVVDTLSLSTGSGLCVLYGCDLADEGTLSGAEIARACQDRTEHVQASFVLDSLNFLHKGGRCSGLARLMASLLKIKPMICLNDGAMGAGKKYRGNFEAVVDKYVDDVLDTFTTPDLTRVFITHTSLPEGLAEHVKERVLARYPFKTVHITTAGGTITSHCGKNTVGVLYINDGGPKK